MTEDSRPPALEVKGVRYAFKKHVALKSVSFEVKAGSLHGFVGSNGAGKTTTLKLAATLLRPQHGVVRVSGHDVAKATMKVRERIGFMPDHFSTYKQMKVDEYLDFFAAAYGLVSKERRRIVDDVLTLTDMEKRRDSLIKGLSRGMQQRLSLARVLINDPELLLLDEPASGLDPRARLELMAILRELSKMGKTVFISSHILSELADLCDSATVIDQGEIKYSGPMEELLIRDGDEALLLLRTQEEHPDLENALTAVPGVQEVEFDRPNVTYRIRVDQAQVSPNAILQSSLSAGAQIVSFDQDRRHLNEVFMDLTSPGVRE